MWHAPPPPGGRSPPLQGHSLSCTSRQQPGLSPAHQAQAPAPPLHSGPQAEGALTPRTACPAESLPPCPPLPQQAQLALLCSSTLSGSCCAPPTSALTCLAPVSCVPCLAAAGEICAQVLAGTPIHAGALGAGGGGCKEVGVTEGLWAARGCSASGSRPLPHSTVGPPLLPGPVFSVEEMLSPAALAALSLAGLACRPLPTSPISQCRPEKPGGQSHLYLPI